MTIRAIIFWLKDFLSGSVSYSHYKQIRNTLNSNRDIIAEQKALMNILLYATKNVPFYKQYYNNDFNLFPIINKSTIINNYQDFCSPHFKLKDLFKEQTSGSTGTPLVIYQNSNKRKHSTADTIAFSEFANFKFGSRLYYSRVWNKLNKKGTLSSIIQNIIPIHSDKLTDTDLQSFLDILERDNKDKSVLIFASTLTALYKYMVNNNICTHAKIKTFITMSEALPKETKNGIKNLFDCPVVSRYSNCECGILAQQSINSDYYIINTSSFKIEIFDLEKDILVPDGVLGRIVVTDLYNYSMPLIRYDTGDIGIKNKINGLDILTQVDGRRIDCIYSTDEKMLSPYIINNNMWQFNEINQYQFIQNHENKYLLKLNTRNKSCELRNKILVILREYLGDNANIEIEYVDEIPLLSSGKRKQVVCNYKKI